MIYYTFTKNSKNSLEYLAPDNKKKDLMAYLLAERLEIWKKRNFYEENKFHAL